MNTHSHSIKGDYKMTANELELFEIVFENDNQELAMQTAVLIILGYLKQHESFGGQAVADLRELV